MHTIIIRSKKELKSDIEMEILINGKWQTMMHSKERRGWIYEHPIDTPLWHLFYKTIETWDIQQQIQFVDQLLRMKRVIIKSLVIMTNRKREEINRLIHYYLQQQWMEYDGVFPKKTGLFAIALQEGLDWLMNEGQSTKEMIEQVKPISKKHAIREDSAEGLIALQE